MKVVILCGGLGTRLREETEFRPKPMVPIGGRPILWHIMKLYAHHGHKEFVLPLGYKGEIIKNYFRNYHWNTSDVTLKLGSKPQITYHNRHDEEDWTVTLLDTGLETQTGGRLRRALAHIPDETFLLTYGDGVADVNLRGLIDFHISHGRLATMTSVRSPARFGRIGFEGNQVTEFFEKPETGEGWINGGFFVLNRKALDYIDGDDTAWERDPVERLARDGQLMGFKHYGFWSCMDTLREKNYLDEMWCSGKAPWKMW